MLLYPQSAFEHLVTDVTKRVPSEQLYAQDSTDDTSTEESETSSESSDEDF